MSYTSFGFIAFLAALFILYFVLPKKIQWIVLLAASYAFYAMAGLKYLPFILLTTVSTFYFALYIGHLYKDGKKKLAENKEVWSAEERKKFNSKIADKKRCLLTAALLLNLGILAFLKYYNFFAENINGLMNLTGISMELSHFNLLLPLGISFYTFQTTGYLIDIYRGRYEPDNNLFKFALFVSFFPQIIQGPISRYDQLAHQLYEPHNFDFLRFKYGLQLMLWGFFKKLVIADRLFSLVENVFSNNTNYAGLQLFIAASFYGVQIYTDFSGGIDIVRGASQVLGIDMTENFKRPYFARSVSDFWQRWHMTLGAWMRNYVFYPLALSKGINRIGKKLKRAFGPFIGKTLPIAIVSLITFMLVGIWHGASWKYVAYGLYYGGLIALSSLLEPLFLRLTKVTRVNTECFSWILYQMLRTNFLITIGRMIMRSGSLGEGIQIIKRTFTTWNPWVLFDGSLYNLGLDGKDLVLVIFCLLILLTVGILQERGVKMRETIARQNLWFQWTLIISVIIVILVFGEYGPEYIASEFIYMQF